MMEQPARIQPPEKSKTIEDDPQGCYCCTAIEFAAGRVILAHCSGRVKLATTQITSFPMEWLYRC